LGLFALPGNMRRDGADLLEMTVDIVRVQNRYRFRFVALHKLKSFLSRAGAKVADISGSLMDKHNIFNMDMVYWIDMNING
jgi:hypothetical protein